MRDLAFNHLVWQESISNPGLPHPQHVHTSCHASWEGPPSHTHRPPPHYQLLKWFGREERHSYHQHVQRVERRHRGLVVGSMPGMSSVTAWCSTHSEEFDHGSQRSKTCLPPFHSTSLKFNVLKVCLVASTCAFCQYEAGHGVSMRSSPLQSRWDRLVL